MTDGAAVHRATREPVGHAAREPRCFGADAESGYAAAFLRGWHTAMHPPGTLRSKMEHSAEAGAIGLRLLQRMRDPSCLTRAKRCKRNTPGMFPHSWQHGRGMLPCLRSSSLEATLLETGNRSNNICGGLSKESTKCRARWSFLRIPKGIVGDSPQVTLLEGGPDGWKLFWHLPEFPAKPRKRKGTGVMQSHSLTPFTLLPGEALTAAQSSAYARASAMACDRFSASSLRRRLATCFFTVASEMRRVSAIA